VQPHSRSSAYHPTGSHHRSKNATTLPVGFCGEAPRIKQHILRRGDRVLCHIDGGEPFGEERLIRCVNRLRDEPSVGVRADLRRLSRTLQSERGGRTSDDATLFVIKWHGGAANRLEALD
jgi:hypothetical protein